MRSCKCASLCIGLAVIGVLALAACSKTGGAGAQMQQPPPPVTVVTLKAQPVTLTRELPGRTSAYLIAEVRPQVNGIVKKRLFTEGGEVKEGQVLYELDDALYRADYNSAQAALAKAQAALEVAKTSANRAAELIKIDAISKQDNENAIASLRQGEADVAAAQAEVRRTGVNLSYSHIIAPIGGRIGKSTVTQGALVSANQTAALATVQQLDPIYIDVTQSSSDWLKLKQEVDSGRVQAGGAGTAVKVVLEDGSQYAQEGKLQFADVTVDPSTGSFLLRVIVPNPNSTLMPGMYVKAVLSEGLLSEGVLAPQVGITRDPKGGATALVVGADNKIEQRQVKVSRTIGDQWLVEDGLKAGDRMVVEGLQKVQPGVMVQPTEAASAAAPAVAQQAGAPAGKS